MVDCFKADLHFALVGFSDAEADTIIMKRFTKGNNPVLQDSLLLSPIRYQRYGDTLQMTAYPGELNLDIDYNYELYFPGSPKVLMISDITEEQLRMKRNHKVGCGNRITGYKLDGQPTTNFDEYNTTYFRR